MLDNFFVGLYDERPLKTELPFVDICFRSRDISFQSLEILRKKCEENWAFCAPLTKIVTSQVGLIQYLNQMSFRRYKSESSKTWYTYETR